MVNNMIARIGGISASSGQTGGVCRYAHKTCRVAAVVQRFNVVGGAHRLVNLTLKAYSPPARFPFIPTPLSQQARPSHNTLILRITPTRGITCVLQLTRYIIFSYVSFTALCTITTVDGNCKCIHFPQSFQSQSTSISQLCSIRAMLAKSIPHLLTFSLHQC